MDRKEFMAKVMLVNSDPSSDESIDAITSLTDFYDSTESAYNEMKTKAETSEEGRKKLALRYAESAVRDEVLSTEEIEEQEMKELNEKFDSKFNQE